jgi:hypothetical protein
MLLLLLLLLLVVVVVGVAAAHRFCRLLKVGVARGFIVRLRLLHMPQEGVAVLAFQGHSHVAPLQQPSAGG